MDIKDLEKEFGVKIDREKVKKAAKWKLKAQFWAEFIVVIIIGAFFGGMAGSYFLQTSVGLGLFMFFAVMISLIGIWYLLNGHPLLLAILSIEEAQEGKKEDENAK